MRLEWDGDNVISLNSKLLIQEQEITKQPMEVAPTVRPGGIDWYCSTHALLFLSHTSLLCIPLALTPSSMFIGVSFISTVD